MKLTNEERSLALEILLGLVKPPLALKFLTRSEEVPDIAEATFTPPSSCALWTQGLKQALSTRPEHHLNCNIGAYTHGVKSIEEIGPECGCDDVDFLLAIRRISWEDLENLPRVREKPSRILYFPLRNAGLEPDVILVFCRANQAQLLFEAAQRAGLQTHFRGMPTCSIIPHAIQSQGVVFGLGCTSSRLRAGYGDDEILVALAPDPLDKLLEFLEGIVASERGLRDYELGKPAIHGRR